MDYDLDVNQVVSLAKQHGRSVAITTFAISFSFVMAIAFFTTTLDGNPLNQAVWWVAAFFGVCVGGVSYGIIYASQGIIPSRQIIDTLFQLYGSYPADGDGEEVGITPRNEREVVEDSETQPADYLPVDGLANQLEKQVSWYSRVNWAGLASFVSTGGELSKNAVKEFVPLRLYLRFGDENALEETFPEAMVRLKFAKSNDTGYSWTTAGRIFFRELGAELGNPPTPDSEAINKLVTVERNDW